MTPLSLPEKIIPTITDKVILIFADLDVDGMHMLWFEKVRTAFKLMNLENIDISCLLCQLTDVCIQVSCNHSYGQEWKRYNPTDYGLCQSRQDTSAHCCML